MKTISARITWVIFGVVFLLLTSPFVILTFKPDYIPPTFPFFFVRFSVFLPLFIIPGLFFLTSLFVNKKNYIHFLLALITIIMAADFFWMAHAWENGVKWKGINFATKSFVENCVSCILIYAAIVLCYLRRNVILLNFTTLLLFTILSVYAFPWFGESI